MFRNMKLGLRLVLGISVILALVLVVGVSGYLGLSRVLEMTKFYRSINLLEQNVWALKEWTDTYLIAVYTDQEDLRQQAIDRTLELADRGLGTVASLRTHARDEEAAENLVRLTEGLTYYKESYGKYIRAEEAKAALVSEINAGCDQLSQQIAKGQLWTDQMLAAGSIFKGAIQSYLAKNTGANESNLADAAAGLEKSIGNWATKVENSGDLKKIADEIKSSYSSINAMLAKYRQQIANQQEFKNLMERSKNSLDEACTHFGNLSARNLEKQTGFSRKIIMTSLITALLIGTLLAVLSVKTILNSMKKVIVQVTEGAEQTLSVSGQVSSASQSLAAGASQQAASIQQTSASLEEMAGTTRQNAQNAQRANEHMQAANQLVDKANGVMENLTDSMNAITQSSEDTHNIVKKIDEIAFQTNLLALNAAVEAARAGEAGSGFAVVADEVRSLAMRAATAAKDTAHLIEATVRQINDGSGLVSETREAFDKVADSVDKAGGLVGEITAASQEQAQGIEQVSRAVLEMDRVTQQNAALAEESAGASEELNSQALQMKSTVDELAALVGRSVAKNTSPEPDPASDFENDNFEAPAAGSLADDDYEIDDDDAYPASQPDDGKRAGQSAAPAGPEFEDF